MLSLRWLRDRYAEAARRHAAELVLIYVSTPLAEIHEARSRNEVTRQRAPILEEVFREHASRFEVPAVDERALIFNRGVPVEDWLDRNLSRLD